jgi:hypothetical protein
MLFHVNAPLDNILYSVHRSAVLFVMSKILNTAV